MKRCPLVPLETPIAFDDLLKVARQLAASDFDSRFSTPVLVVVPSSDNIITEAVDITRPNALANPSPGPEVAATLVFWVRPGKQSPNLSRLSVGRDDACDVVIPFGSLSKTHAYLVQLAQGEWQVEDAASKNGTWVDGRQVRPKVSAPLRDGAEVKFGDVVATFWLAASFRAALRRRAGLK